MKKYERIKAEVVLIDEAIRNFGASDEVTSEDMEFYEKVENDTVG